MTINKFYAQTEKNRNNNLNKNRTWPMGKNK